MDRPIERTLLIDADDTLWENNIFYLQCTARFQDYMARMGLAPEATLDMLNACERETIQVAGYGPHGFVMALGLACEKLLRQMGREASSEVIAGARACGNLVLAPPMILLAGVEPALRALRPTSQLVMVTKGSEESQRDKIRRSGLAPLFDAFYIVPEKDISTYYRIGAELGLEPRRAWMVGNSPKSDINPAIRAGLGAILIPHDHTWTAELQTIDHPELVVTLQRFADLLPFFGIAGAE